MLVYGIHHDILSLYIVLFWCSLTGAYNSIVCRCSGRSECSDQGECLNCTSNTAGPSCERCLPDYYNDTSVFQEIGCVQCECNSLGSINTTCDESSGQCICNEGVDNDTRTCDTCADGFFNLTKNGCESEFVP